MSLPGISAVTGLILEVALRSNFDDLSPSTILDLLSLINNG